MAQSLLEKQKGISVLTLTKSISRPLEKSEGYWPESGSTWWQLLEQREELSLCLSQQQRPVEPQQQHWVPPGCSSLGDGVRRLSQPSSGVLNSQDAGVIRLPMLVGDIPPAKALEAFNLLL